MKSHAPRSLRRIPIPELSPEDPRESPFRLVKSKVKKRNSKKKKLPFFSPDSTAGAATEERSPESSILQTLKKSAIDSRLKTD